MFNNVSCNAKCQRPEFSNKTKIMTTKAGVPVSITERLQTTEHDGTVVVSCNDSVPSGSGGGGAPVTRYTQETSLSFSHSKVKWNGELLCNTTNSLTAAIYQHLTATNPKYSGIIFTCKGHLQTLQKLHFMIHLTALWAFLSFVK